jgi:excisionase family DNA binding protein
VITERGAKWVSKQQFLQQHVGIVGEATLRKWINTNRIPHIRIGKKVLLPEDASDRVYEHEIKHTS